MRGRASGGKGRGAEDGGSITEIFLTVKASRAKLAPKCSDVYVKIVFETGAACFPMGEKRIILFVFFCRKNLFASAFAV